jgi:hypothetical protein
VGTVICNCPVGSTATVSVTLATTSCRESVALNTLGVPAGEVSPQGAGFIRKLGDVHGFICNMINTLMLLG